MTAIGQGNLEYHRTFRVMRTAAEMMEDRKYDIPRAMIPDSFDEFMQRYVDEVLVDAQATGGVGGGRKLVIRRDKMMLPCRRVAADGANPHLGVVVFCAPNSLTTAFIKDNYDKAVKESCRRIVFVTPSRPNAVVKRAIDTINKSVTDVRIELFEEDDLAVNITKHELVPKHTPLEPEELAAVMQAHALKVEQLPRILSSDPVAMYYGLERGQVVRIERKSDSAGVYVTYRQVA